LHRRRRQPSPEPRRVTAPRVGRKPNPTALVRSVSEPCRQLDRKGEIQRPRAVGPGRHRLTLSAHRAQEPRHADTQRILALRR